jgi:hypothetical protein
MWGGPFRHQSLRWGDLRRPWERIRNQAGTRLLLRQTTKENFLRPSLRQDAHGFDVVSAPQLLRDLTRVPTPEAEIRVPESSMQKKSLSFLAFAFLAALVLLGATRQAGAQAEKASYPAMAPLDQYLIPEGISEIALARSAAPASISDGAEVMVLGPKGYTTAVKGTNGFLCIVERSWGAATDESEFWNPKVRAPICFTLQPQGLLCPSS